MRRPPTDRFPLPSWAINLAGFGLLTGLVVAVFLWQLKGVDRDLHRNTLDRSRMMATIIEEHLANGALAGETIDTVVTSFLRDKARFIDYLNAIDPLQGDELTALARETGLLGISLIYRNGEVVNGPDPWQQEGDCSLAPDQVHYDPEQETGQLLYPGSGTEIRCIRLAMDARAIVDLRRKTALPALLAGLSALPGVHAIRLEQDPVPDQDPVRLIKNGAVSIAEARLATPRGTLVVGLDAANHQRRLTQLRRQFTLFSSLLLGLGLFFSWLLYRFQQADLNRTRAFERLLAREHEAAALGRATATIAHEIRNPLNAISMGLQRLQLESDPLATEQAELLHAMEAAVGRAETIIAELQRFTRKLTPRLQMVAPAQLLLRIAALYRHRCEVQDIALELSLQDNLAHPADPELLAELMENLIKNSVEAQPDGGFISIALERWAGGMRLVVINGGCALAPGERNRPGEPYFTTKTRGTGLGLALCRRIAEAHGGSLLIQPEPEHNRFTVSLTLPGGAPGSARPPLSEPSEEDRGEYSDR